MQAQSLVKIGGLVQDQKTIVQALKQAGVDMKKNVVFMGGDDSYVLKAVFD